MKGKGLCKYSPAEQTNPWYAALSDREKHTLLFWDSFRRIPRGDEPEELVDLGMSLYWPPPAWRELGERPDAGV